MKLEYKDEAAGIDIDIHRREIKSAPEMNKEKTMITVLFKDRFVRSGESTMILAEGKPEDIIKAFGVINAQFHRIKWY